VKLTFLALLLFAAPAPFAESFTAEEEVVVQSSKSVVRPAAPRESPKAPPSPVSRPAVRRIVTDLPARLLTEWTPAVCTRPPPRT